MSAPNNENNDFEKASQQKQSNLLSEFLGFLGQNKKYWLLPLILVMLALAGLLVLSSTAAAPFIYTLF
ncbi:MAG: DUF5989 family protein [Roseimicrobium sp.]